MQEYNFKNKPEPEVRVGMLQKAEETLRQMRVRLVDRMRRTEEILPAILNSLPDRSSLNWKNAKRSGLALGVVVWSLSHAGTMFWATSGADERPESRATVAAFVAQAARTSTPTPETQASLPPTPTRTPETRSYEFDDFRFALGTFLFTSTELSQANPNLISSLDPVMLQSFSNNQSSNSSSEEVSSYKYRLNNNDISAQDINIIRKINVQKSRASLTYKFKVNKNKKIVPVSDNVNLSIQEKHEIADALRHYIPAKGWQQIRDILTGIDHTNPQQEADATIKSDGTVEVIIGGTYKPPARP